MGVNLMDEVTVGRIVHYISYGTPGGEFAPEHRAAVVTEVVSENAVGLCVLNPTGMFFNRGVVFDPTAASPGSWHWPERA